MWGPNKSLYRKNRNNVTRVIKRVVYIANAYHGFPWLGTSVLKDLKVSLIKKNWSYNEWNLSHQVFKCGHRFLTQSPSKGINILHKTKLINKLERLRWSKFFFLTCFGIFLTSLFCNSKVVIYYSWWFKW